MIKKFLLITLLLSLCPFLFAQNLLKNGEFEEGKEPWALSGNGVEIIKESGNRFIHLENKKNRYIEAANTVKIKPGKFGVITVKAKIKIKNVIKGPEDWAYARVMVLFFDKNGKQTGGWPELGRWSGTFGWAEKINIINVPADAAKIKIQAQLSNCTGEMWADDIRVMPGDKLEIPREQNNMALNGSMEYGSKMPFYWGGWINGASAFISPGKDSPTCFKITNDTKAYSMITQQVPVDTASVRAVIVSGWLKGENVVKGDNEWEQARISLEFHNDKGRFGGWPDVTGELTGTTEWKYFENTYFVPKETKFIKLSAGLLEASGAVYIDRIKVTGKTHSGKIYEPPAFASKNRSDWWEFSPKKDDFSGGAVIDFTDSLDAPAGKHGALIIKKDGSLRFRDGTKAKFWGTNLVGGDCFRNKEKADRTVKKLAKLGCNLVRFHHMDAPWAEPNIFAGGNGSTRGLSSESLDKLDYIIYKLEQAGIYVFLDLLVHRRPGPNDGVDNYKQIPNGFKEVVFIDETLQSLTKEYIKKLLTHKNKYTGKTYAEDPAVLFTEIINESSIFYWDRNKDIPPEYTKKLNKMFNDFLRKKYSSMKNLREEWDKYGDSNLSPGENFNKNTVKRAKFKINWEDWPSFAAGESTGRSADTKLFYYEVEKNFYDEMYDYIKSLGTKALVTGSNHWEKWDADLLVNSKYDFIDRHTYWDHPSGGWTFQENIAFHNRPMLKTKQNSVAELAHCRVYGKPFTVSEWNMLPPNEHVAGSPLLMASYAAFQGWDAMMQFNYATYEWENMLTHFADFSRNPVVISNWFPAVKAYMDSYVSAGSRKIVDFIPRESIFFSKKRSFSLINSGYAAPLMIKSYKTFDKNNESKLFDPKTKKSAALSTTGELYWNFKKGLFQINAEKIQGACGFLDKAQKPLQFNNLKLRSRNKYASIFITSLDGKALSSAKKIILNTTARVDNSGAKYSPAHTSVIYGGTRPVIIEPVYSEIEIEINGFKDAVVYKLDANNYKDGEYGNYSTNSGTITIKTDENSKCLNYYVEIKR